MTLYILNLWMKAALMWVLTNTFCNFVEHMSNLDKYILNWDDLRFSENFIEGMWNVALCILNLLWMKAALTNTMILKSYFQLYFHHISIIFLIIFQKIWMLALWMKENFLLKSVIFVIVFLSFWQRSKCLMSVLSFWAVVNSKDNSDIALGCFGIGFKSKES